MKPPPKRSNRPASFAAALADEVAQAVAEHGGEHGEREQEQRVHVPAGGLQRAGHQQGLTRRRHAEALHRHRPGDAGIAVALHQRLHARHGGLEVARRCARKRFRVCLQRVLREGDAGQGEQRDEDCREPGCCRTVRTGWGLRHGCLPGDRGYAEPRCIGR